MQDVIQEQASVQGVRGEVYQIPQIREIIKAVLLHLKGLIEEAVEHHYGQNCAGEAFVR